MRGIGRRSTVALVAIGLLPLALTTPTSATAAADGLTSSIDGTVSAFLQRLPSGSSFSDLLAAAPGAPIPAYDLGGSLAGWEIPLGLDGAAGYAVVTPSNGTLEVSRLAHGDLAAETSAAVSRALQALDETLPADTPAVQVLDTTPLLVDNFDPVVTVSATNGQVIDADLGDSSVGLYEPSGAQPMSASDATTTPTVTSAGASTLKYIPYGESDTVMPYFQWFDGCTPTAQAMIEAYWSRFNNMDSLFPQADYLQAKEDDLTYDAAAPALPYNSGTTDAIISTLGTYMQTTAAGDTQLTNIAQGIRQYETAAGVNRTVTEITNNPNVATMTGLIDQGNPTLASFIGISIFFPWSSTTDQLAADGIISVSDGGYDSYHGMPVNHSIALTGYFVAPTGATYMISHDDARIDQDAMILFNDSWSQNQYDYEVSPLTSFTP